jgi:hypothetical protein
MRKGPRFESSFVQCGIMGPTKMLRSIVPHGERSADQPPAAAAVSV